MPTSRSDTLKIGAFNCHGLKDKIDYPDFLKLALKMDVLGVSETWLKNGDQISLPGFKFFPINRKVSKGAPRGGIGIFIKNEVK